MKPEIFVSRWGAAGAARELPDGILAAAAAAAAAAQPWSPPGAAAGPRVLHSAGESVPRV